MIDLRERLRTALCEYRCHHTRDAERTGLLLSDMLTPPDREEHWLGLDEVDRLADHILSDWPAPAAEATAWEMAARGLAKHLERHCGEPADVLLADYGAPVPGKIPEFDP